MRRWLARLAIVLPIASYSALCFGQAAALEGSLKRLNDPALHCGHKPSLDLFNGVMSALSEPQTTAAELSLRREDRRLELLIHFEYGQVQIPLDCEAKLRSLNESAKSGRSGPILIRSSTRTEGSTELDLALASQRLDALQAYLRGNRLARKAFVLELHPENSSPLFGDAIALPNLVEVYSSPAN